MTVTEAEFTKYTDSLCWVLAFAISDITGWPVVGLGIDNVTPEQEKSGYRDWSHLAVRMPNGNFLDIQGEQCAELFDFMWEQFTLESHYDYCDEIEESWEDCPHEVVDFEVSHNVAYRRNLLDGVEKPHGSEFVVARKVAHRLLSSLM